MPGPALHHMIADRLRTRLAASDGLGRTLTAAEYAQIDALLSDPKNLPYLFLGCQGPDFLFFNTRDINATVKDLVTAYFDVYDFIENFKRDLKALVPQPVLDALAAFDEATNAVVTSSSTLTELQQLFRDMQQVVDGLAATLLEAVKTRVSDFNLFDFVSHPYRDGVPMGPKPAGFSVPAERATAKNEWWWFDAMHYRKTGKFAKRLLERTTPGSPLHLYAIGYLTHVAADTVGHPYVNAISGGPYRSQAQRHKASENYQDVFNFVNVRATDWNRSAIHAFYNVNFSGSIDTENNEPDAFTNLPNALATLLADTLNEIYNEDAGAPSPDYATRISANDISDTYRLWYRWFENATDTGTLPAPVPYSLTAELREVWDKAVDNLGSIGDFIEDAADTAGNLGIWGIFLLLGALILAALAAAAALIDAVLGALTTLGSATIRYVACLIYEQLYNAYETFRLAVAMKRFQGQCAMADCGMFNAHCSILNAHFSGHRDRSESVHSPSPKRIQWRKVGSSAQLRVVESGRRVDNPHMFQVVEENDGTELVAIFLRHGRQSHIELPRGGSLQKNSVFKHDSPNEAGAVKTFHP